MSGGPDDILQRMVGDDVWLMDKRNPFPPKQTKKSGGKRKHVLSCSVDESPNRRRQSWLGEQVGELVRRLRTSFFACDLTSKHTMTCEEEEKLGDCKNYVASFVGAMQRCTKRAASLRMTLILTMMAERYSEPYCMRASRP